MFSPSTIIIVSLFYIGILFLIALWVERRSGKGKKPVNNPVIYSLSLAVYFTSWTFFGGVGYTASSGILFITIYLGPILSMFVWWWILRKIIRIKNFHRISSIADFISARYGRSKSLAAIATLVALVGIMPYVALQLKSVTSTFAVISSSDNSGGSFSHWGLPLIITILMFLFTIVFGVRRLDPTERHEGIVAALAVESVVKLVAFVAVGVFVVFFLFDGFSDIFRQLANSPYDQLLTITNQEQFPFVTWATHLVLSISAFLFLPRQFHVAVVENSNEKHILTAMWLLPLYMFLLTFFIFPITAGGLLEGFLLEMADTFVLNLPRVYGNPWLTMLVFIGGVSASTGMIIVSSMTLSTMVTNNLLLPVLGKVKKLAFLRRYLLQIRWAAVGIVLFLGYLFERSVGESHFLVSMGVISFAAALQFVPVLLGGIFWRKGNKAGALLGLSSGFLVWFYTLFLPAIVQSGWLPASLLEKGLWGISFLRPEALFGLDRFDNLSHSVFWSMLFNIGFYFLGSLYFRQSQEEQSLAEEFVGVMSRRVVHQQNIQQGDAYVNLAEKIEEIRNLLNQFFLPAKTEEVLDSCLEIVNLCGQEWITIIGLAELHEEIERRLAGSIGAAAARETMKKAVQLSSRESRELSEVYSKILANLNIPIYELRQRVDYYQERETLLTSHARELEDKVRERDEQITERKRAESELRRLRNYLSNIINSMPSVLVGVDADGKITQWNVEAYRITGVSEDHALGQPLHQVFPRLEAEMERLKEAVRSREVQSNLKQPRLEDGEILYEDITIFPLVTNGVEGAVVRIDDVTERVRIEEMIVQSEKMLSVGGLAAGMAHEINNPLAGIIQTASVLTNRLNSGRDIPANLRAAAEAGTTIEAVHRFMELRDVPRMLDAINQSGRRVAAIVQNMLSFARKSNNMISTYDLNEVLDKTLDLAATDYDLKKHYDFKRIKILKEYDTELPPAPCESSKIQQVLFNILRNGAEAMQDAEVKTPTFILRTYYEENRNMACIEITDNGPGMDEETRKRVFEPFFTTKPPGKGTGLGLSVSYFIITENHKGIIEVDSQLGKGSVFTIHLPYGSI